MLVLGIDPGLAATGYGLLSWADEGGGGQIKMIEGGVIRSEAKDPVERRVGSIYKGIVEIIREFKPSAMAMEDIFSHYKHPKTGIIMAHARGAILAAADATNIPVSHYAATMIKKSLTGNGRANKEQVRQTVLSQFRITGPAEPFDTYDALAAGLCHINHSMRVVEN